MPVTDYEERKQSKIERMQERAAKATDESNKQYEKAQRIGEMIPFGQPILVGHHSEGRHRNHLKKIDNAMRNSIEASNKAKHYANRARFAESNKAISSDDPEAIQKLKGKVAKTEEKQAAMKIINKGYKAFTKNPEADLVKLGLTAEQINAVKTYAPRYSYDTKPFPAYSMTNNNANIQRMKKRIETLSREYQRQEAPQQISGEGWELVENADENRIQFLFDGKPEVEIRSELKHNGFRWSPRNTAWQRQLNNAGRYAAKRVAEYLKS